MEKKIDYMDWVKLVPTFEPVNVVFEVPDGAITIQVQPTIDVERRAKLVEDVVNTICDEDGITYSLLDFALRGEIINAYTDMSLKNGDVSDLWALIYNTDFYARITSMIVDDLLDLRAAVIATAKERVAGCDVLARRLIAAFTAIQDAMPADFAESIADVLKSGFSAIEAQKEK